MTQLIRAARIAEAVGIFPPTEEQRRVIEHEGEQPALVIAGAGAGKTETMSRRVVWLVANGVVSPDQVLGLTFTRKAASELSSRIDGALRALVRSGLVDSVDLSEPPSVSTYNSFANMLFQDNALRIGREPDSTLLTEAGAWGLAHEVVLASDDEESLYELGKSPTRVAEMLLTLTHAMIDNNAEPDDVLRFAQEFARLTELPPKPRARKPGPGKEVTDSVSAVQSLQTLVPLAVEYQRRKRERGLIEYADQVALALEAIRRDPSAAEPYRQQFDAVLLDEYQDTSVSQTRLLSTLFHGQRVMAVGDPNQSIYGWRGASSENLEGFHRDFGTEGAPANFQLATSWRNSRSILDVANALVADAGADSSVPVVRLQSRSGAPDGAVQVSVSADLEAEADAVAAWMRDRMSDTSTGAVLFRARALMPVFAQALARAGVPHEIVGFAGVLEAPEVVDLLSALRVVHSADADNSLVRLLAGARWRVGPADLQALGSLARQLASYDADLQKLAPAVREQLRQSVARDDHATLVDALDLMVSGGPRVERLITRAGFSRAGMHRLRDAGALLRSLRSQAHLPLTEFMRLVIERLGIDVELRANESLRRPMQNLDALLAKASEYMHSAPASTLGGFLSWIAQVERRERLSIEGAQAQQGVVQLLTVHAAKGLEWDHVAVPRLVQGEMPARLTSTKGWLSAGELPYEFRGDRLDLPELAWRTAADAAEFGETLEAFGEHEKRRHLDEERRIAYVAFTRGRDDLLLSCSAYRAERAGARTPSVFLSELVERGVLTDFSDEFTGQPEPVDHGVDQFPWPQDPLGARRASVAAAAAAVEAVESVPDAAALGADPATWPDIGGWKVPIEALLKERADAGRGLSIELPSRVAASRMHEFLTDPVAVAAQLYRPMPTEPHRETRVGTLFHEWVERRYRVSDQEFSLTTESLFDDLQSTSAFDEQGRLRADGLDPEERPGTAPTVLDEQASAQLARLQETFERSRWATAQPVAVETQIRLPLGDVQTVCKLDAVFRTDEGYEVVDWKTGRAPQTAGELEERQIQLALYRLAWAQHAGVDVADVSARFYYVADDREIAPSRFFTADELAERWATIAS